MRSRLLQRIHLAMLRGAGAKKSSDSSDESFVGLDETDKYEDADGLLTATSIRMSLAIMQCLAPTSSFSLLIYLLTSGRSATLCCDVLFHHGFTGAFLSFGPLLC
jgi:hypothetical protein